MNRQLIKKYILIISAYHRKEELEVSRATLSKGLRQTVALTWLMHFDPTLLLTKLMGYYPQGEKLYSNQTHHILKHFSLFLRVSPNTVAGGNAACHSLWIPTPLKTVSVTPRSGGVWTWPFVSPQQSLPGLVSQSIKFSFAGDYLFISARQLITFGRSKLFGSYFAAIILK